MNNTLNSVLSESVIQRTLKGKINPNLSLSTTSSSTNHLGEKIVKPHHQQLRKAHENNHLSLETETKADKLTFSKVLKEEIESSVKDGLKKGAKSYKEALEREDVGVKVAGTGIEKAIITPIKTKKLLKTEKEVVQNRQKLKVKKKQLEAHVKGLQKEKKGLDKKSQESIQNKQDLKAVKSELKEHKQGIRKQRSQTFIKKGVITPIDKGVNAYKNNLERNDQGVKVASKGIGLTKQGVTTANKVSKKLKKGKSIDNTSNKKLGKKNSKLIKKNVNSPEKARSKTQIKKQVIKKKMYNPIVRQRFLHNGAGLISRAGIATKNFVSSLNMATVKKAVAGKVTVAIGGSSTILIALGITMALLFMILLLGGIGGGQKQIDTQIGVAQNLSPEVEQWRDLVSREAEAQGMTNYVSLILAIIQVESGGRGTRDIMQSSESAGLPPNTFQSEEESIRQGVTYLRSIIEILQGFNQGYENNAKLIAQAYNFGSPFARYVGNRGGEYDLEVAEAYSRDIVAPSLGNYNGTTYSYVNTISQSVGKTYLYRNGGNYLYGEMVGQYIGGVSGDFATVLAEIEKYQGWEYVWGGKSPTTGFDCSGLVAWGLKQLGINLPSPASNQYAMTVPVSPEEARTGDLIFFKGTYGSPDHVSHVGFYVNENTMYDANGSGVGYHNWQSDYWQKHQPEIRRVVQ